MPGFAEDAEDFWTAPYDGRSVIDSRALHLVVNEGLEHRRRATILARPGLPTLAAVTPEVALRAGLDLRAVADAGAIAAAPGVTSVEDLRVRLADADVKLGDPDLVYLFPAAQRTVLLAATPPSTVRELTADDADVFADLIAACTPEDVDLAYVELDHWRVVGSFDEDALACVASAYPWGEGPMADIGVLSAPDRRGNGHARRATRALAAVCWREGYEPQYRTQPDNPASQAVALAAGMEHYGDWETVAEE
ncbi:GNAT family N-acetyltransferase [Demequina sp. NBRC 110052]|uniref:GNAT family N-acetyltransferase n=1 Tax=Demequina sp. NBRC 110052 TaxID=1570341 RepID=UPI000A011B0D|nr:GNAT family N-acetyltransferase [Demequina sp. NBRC 110052]